MDIARVEGFIVHTFIRFEIKITLLCENSNYNYTLIWNLFETNKHPLGSVWYTGVENQNGYFISSV